LRGVRFFYKALVNLRILGGFPIYGDGGVDGFFFPNPALLFVGDQMSIDQDSLDQLKLDLYDEADRIHSNRNV